MGFPWYIKEEGWDNMHKAFDKYFANKGSEGCCLFLDGEVWVVDYKVMKVGDGDGNYYDNRE